MASVVLYFSKADITEGFWPSSTIAAVAAREPSYMYASLTMRESGSATPSITPTGIANCRRIRA